MIYLLNTINRELITNFTKNYNLWKFMFLET